MDVDARRTAHPIQQPVADESEAESVFDSITYLKSQAFIRELENYLGAEKFRDGIRHYMAAHAYSNATTADLWLALQRASGKQVASIAIPYTEQPGVPLIVSSASCVNDQQRLTLRQERFTRGAAKGRRASLADTDRFRSAGRQGAERSRTAARKNHAGRGRAMRRADQAQFRRRGLLSHPVRRCDRKPRWPSRSK